MSKYIVLEESGQVLFYYNNQGIKTDNYSNTNARKIINNDVYNGFEKNILSSLLTMPYKEVTNEMVTTDYIRIPSLAELGWSGGTLADDYSIFNDGSIYSLFGDSYTTMTGNNTSKSNPLLVRYDYKGRELLSYATRSLMYKWSDTYLPLMYHSRNIDGYYASFGSSLSYWDSYPNDVEGVISCIRFGKK